MEREDPYEYYAAQGPYDPREVGQRMGKARTSLRLTIRDICNLVGWSPASWDGKVRATRNAKGKIDHFSIKDISAAIGAMKKLRPDWKVPLGFPFLPKDVSAFIESLLDSKKH